MRGNVFPDFSLGITGNVGNASAEDLVHPVRHREDLDAAKFPPDPYLFCLLNSLGQLLEFYFFRVDFGINIGDFGQAQESINGHVAPNNGFQPLTQPANICIRVTDVRVQADNLSCQLNALRTDNDAITVLLVFVVDVVAGVYVVVYERGVEDRDFWQDC